MVAPNLEKDALFLDAVRSGRLRVCFETGYVNNTRTGKIYTRVSNNGYVEVPMKVEGKKYGFLAHRLVWMAFHDRLVPEGLEINHKDGCRTRNSISNLEAITPSKNVQHAWDSGLTSKDGVLRYSDDDVRRAIASRKNGESFRSIAKAVGCSKDIVRLWVSGRSRKDVVAESIMK